MTDKPIIIGLGGLEDGASVHIARILAEKGLTHHDVIIIDSTKHKSVESIKREIEEHSGKVIAIDDVVKMIEDSQPKEKSFAISARPVFNEVIVTRKEVEEYHPFSKFINKGKKKKW